ncbi:18630_t:CDS:2, partial [Gigaspora margarita]
DKEGKLSKKITEDLYKSGNEKEIKKEATDLDVDIPEPAKIEGSYLNIEHAENGEILMFKVGNVSECMDIIEAINSKIVYHLFDPGGRHKAYTTPEKTDTTGKCHFMIVKHAQNVVKNKKKNQCKNCDINEEYISILSESQNVKLICTEKARFVKEQHMKFYSNCVYCPRHPTKTKLRKKFTSEDSTEKMSLRFPANYAPTNSSLKETISLNYQDIMIPSSSYLKILTEWLDNQISERLITCYDYDEFNILEKIGEGAYADVHKAEWKDSSTVRTVALKFMKSVKSLETLHE